MGIEWVRIYDSKPEVKMALGKKEVYGMRKYPEE